MQDATSTYAGIGSRSTPPQILAQMRRLAGELAGLGWTLRSGAAQGADTAFEEGALAAGGGVELYLPWPGFQGRRQARLVRPTAAAMAMAERFHPAWHRVSPGARPLHARNSHQVLGPALDDPVALVICWTRGALGGGGTGQALRIARAHGIPVVDLAHASAGRELAALRRRLG